MWLYISHKQLFPLSPRPWTNNKLYFCFSELVGKIFLDLFQQTRQLFKTLGSMPRVLFQPSNLTQIQGYVSGPQPLDCRYVSDLKPTWASGIGSYLPFWFVSLLISAPTFPYFLFFFFFELSFVLSNWWRNLNLHPCLLDFPCC